MCLYIYTYGISFPTMLSVFRFYFHFDFSQSLFARPYCSSYNVSKVRCPRLRVNCLGVTPCLAFYEFHVLLPAIYCTAVSIALNNAHHSVSAVFDMQKLYSSY